VNQEQTKQLGLLVRLSPQKDYAFLRLAARTYDGRYEALPARDRDSDTFLHLNDARASGINELSVGDVFQFEIATDFKSNRAKAVTLVRVEV
jgi:cold shock CspA family protein